MKIIISLLMLGFLGMASCKSSRMVNKYSNKIDTAPDYSQPANWAALPWFKSPADSVSLYLRASYKKDSLADVFYIHPTTLTNNKYNGWNASLEDEHINHKTDYTALLYQATAFAEKCRVFAPRYRQAHLRSYFSGEKNKAEAAFALAYKDVKASFEYYLQHFNNGRPFIIASHSQGTNHAMLLIKELIEGKPLQQKMIAAYLIGMPVPNTYFTGIPACESDTAIHCIISWRTYQYGYPGSAFVQSEKFKAIVVNPLTWTTTAEYAPASYNAGVMLRNFNKIIPALTDAKIEGNILWSHKPKFFGNFLLRTKNYHIADVNFFYENTRENVEMRINTYFSKNSF